MSLALASNAVRSDTLAVRYYEDALSRFDAGDTKGAAIQLKNALQRDPGQLSAKILLGRVYLAQGRPREAEEELSQALQLGADPGLVAVDLARARNAIGQYDINLEKIIPIQFPRPQQADLWVELGLARLYKNDPDGARIAFEQALKAAPGHVGGRTGLARIPLRENDFPKAQQLAEDILVSSPDAAEAWLIKGSAAHALGRFDEAIEAYGRAYQLDGQNVEAALGEATATLEAGDPARAAAMLQPLRKAYPWLATIPYLQSEAFSAIGQQAAAEEARNAASNLIDRFAAADVAHSPSKLLLFGTIAFKSNRLETALKFLSAYVQTNGSDPQGRKLLGKTLLGLGKPGEAQKVLVRVSATELADAESLALLGDAHVQLGDLDAAARYYRSALRDHNGGPAILRRLGMTQFQGGQRERALGTLEALIDQTSGAANTDTALLLGLLYFSENRFAEAGGIADRLSREQPDNLTARNLQALVTLAMGNTDLGRQRLESIVSDAPTFKPARYNLIKLDIAQGRSAAAAEALRAMREDDPNDTRALLESARFAQSQGDRRLAIQHLEQLRKIEPGNVLGNVELINTYLAANDTATALNRAIALDRLVPKQFLVKEALTRAQIARGEGADASITLRDAARIAGDDPVRLLQTARLQAQVGALDDAAWTLSKALAADPGMIAARNELATVLFLQRKPAEAEAEVERVLDADPGNLRGRSLLGDIRMSQGRFDEAVDLFERARATADTPSLVASQHRAMMSLGRDSDALDLIESWNAGNPGAPLIVGLLADHLAYNGQAAQALALRKQLVSLTPNSARAWYKLSKALGATDSEGALQAAMRARELAPNDANALDTLGWTLIQLGELDKGLAHLREAVSRNGRSATIRYHLAVALQEFGNHRGARKELQRALKLSNNFAERDDALARLASLR